MHMNGTNISIEYHKENTYNTWEQYLIYIKYIKQLISVYDLTYTNIRMQSIWTERTYLLYNHEENTYNTWEQYFVYTKQLISVYDLAYTNILI